MIVGAAVVEFHVHGSQSLKAKRGVVRSICQRVRNRFNLSVAEVGGQGTWQIAVIGMTTVGADARAVRRVLDRAVAFVEDLHLAEVLDSDIELIELPYQGVSEGVSDPWDDEDDDEDDDADDDADDGGDREADPGNGPNRENDEEGPGNGS